MLLQNLKQYISGLLEHNPSSFIKVVFQYSLEETIRVACDVQGSVKMDT